MKGEKKRKEPSNEEVSSSKLPPSFFYFIQTGKLFHNITNSGWHFSLRKCPIEGYTHTSTEIWIPNLDNFYYKQGDSQN